MINSFWLLDGALVVVTIVQLLVDAFVLVEELLVLLYRPGFLPAEVVIKD